MKPTTSNTHRGNGARRLTGGNHPEYLLTAYLFESISEEGRREVEGHLKGCEACREELEELRGTLGLLRDSVPDASGDLPEYSFDERRLQRVLAAKAQHRAVSWILQRRRIWIPAMASAALILIGVVIVLPGMYLSTKASLEKYAAVESVYQPSAAERFEQDGKWQDARGGDLEDKRAGRPVTGGASLSAPSLPGGAPANGPAPAADPTPAIVDATAGEAVDESPPMPQPDPTAPPMGTRTSRSLVRPSLSPATRPSRSAKPATEKFKTAVTAESDKPAELSAELGEEEMAGEITVDIPKGSELDRLSNLNLNGYEPLVASGRLAQNTRTVREARPPRIPPAAKREKLLEDQSQLRVFDEAGTTSWRHATRSIRDARKELDLLVANGSISRDDARKFRNSLGTAGKQAAQGLLEGREELKKKLQALPESGTLEIQEHFYRGDSNLNDYELGGVVRHLEERIERLSQEDDGDLEGLPLVVKYYGTQAEGEEESRQGAVRGLYAWKRRTDDNGLAMEDFYAAYAVRARDFGVAGKSIAADPFGLERGFRAYGYYRRLDPELSLESFSARKLSVPSPAVGDEGLGREEFRRRYGVNPFVDTLRDHFSTFGMDVDTASYTFIRNLLRSGKLPDSDAVRTEEWVNYFRGVHQADPDNAFSVFADGGPSPFGKDLELLKITVKAREVRPGERRPLVLTFAVDTSGSMATPVSTEAAQRGVRQGDISAESRLALVRHALRTLSEALEPQDRVALVAYSTHPYLVLPHTPAREISRVLGAIDSLQPTGATNVEAGVDLAYRIADEVFEPKAVNRVVLCSDGVANLGARGPEEILQKVQVFARRGIYLSCVGFGMGRYNDRMLETLADQGNGKYTYVDTAAEAEKLFRDDLSSTLDVLAQDAKIQVDFNSEVVSHYRLLGYENRDIRDQDFRNDKVDAGEVGPGSTVTVLYEIRRRANPRGDLGKIYLRYLDTASRKVEETNYPLSPGVLATELSESSERFRFIAAVAETAELLRDSYWARDGSYGKVLQLLGTLSEEFRSRPEVREFTEVALRAQVLTVQRMAQTVR